MQQGGLEDSEAVVACAEDTVVVLGATVMVEATWLAKVKPKTRSFHQVGPPG